MTESFLTQLLPAFLHCTLKVKDQGHQKTKNIATPSHFVLLPVNVFVSDCHFKTMYFTVYPTVDFRASDIIDIVLILQLE